MIILIRNMYLALPHEYSNILKQVPLQIIIRNFDAKRTQQTPVLKWCTKETVNEQVGGSVDNG